MKFQRELAGSLTHMWLGCLWRRGHGAAASGPARVSCCIHGVCTEKGGTRGGSFCLEVWSCRRFKPCLSCKSFRQPHRITWKTLCHSVFRTVHQCFQVLRPPPSSGTAEFEQRGTLIRSAESELSNKRKRKKKDIQTFFSSTHNIREHLHIWGDVLFHVSTVSTEKAY